MANSPQLLHPKETQRKTIGVSDFAMNKINTVIFDMDGTVLNTLEDLTASVNYVLERFGMPRRKETEYRQFFGSGIRYAIQCAVPKGTSEELIDQMLPVFKTHYGVHCLDRTKPYDGVTALMKYLKEHGYRMAIVSNKIDPAVKELNERFFSEYVDVAIGERDGIKRKPAPDTVEQALRELDSTKEESVYIGDSEVDLQTAKNAGIPCIAVLWGFRDRAFLEEKGATLFAERPEDIVEML